MKLVSITDMWLEVVTPADKADLVRALLQGRESRTSANGRTPLAQSIVAFHDIGVTVFLSGVPEEYVAKKTGRKGLFFECSDEVLAVVVLKLFSDISDITEIDES